MPTRQELVARAQSKWNREQLVAQAHAKWESENQPDGDAPPQTSAGQAGLEHFGNAATLGYLPHLQAMAQPVMNRVLDAVTGNHVADDDKSTYVQRRDANIDRLELEGQEHRLASGLGTGAGMLASAVGMGGLGAVAKGASAAQRLSAARNAGMLLGGLANPGDVKGEVDPLQLEQRGVNSVIGGVAGIGGQVVAEGAGAVASRVGQWARDKAAKSATRALGRPTPTVAAKMAKSGDDIRIGRELLDEGAIPILGTPGRIAKRVEDLKQKSWAKVEELLGSAGDKQVVDGAEAGMSILNSDELKLLRQAGEQQSVKALEDAAEQLAGMGKVSLKEAQQIKRTIDTKINYNKADPTAGATQEGRFAKRTALRDQMDQAAGEMGAGEGALKEAFRKQGRLEKAAEIGERESGRLQANDKISLTDAIAAVGGAASGDDGKDSAGRALLFMALNKGRRAMGPAMAARGYDAIAKQLLRVPKFSSLAQANPAGFSAMVQRVSEKLGGGVLQPQFAQDGERGVAGEATPDKQGLIESGNIDLNNRPRFKNPDGSVSTVRSMSINVGGREVLIPTISDDGRSLTPQQAVKQYRDTGKHLGIFSDPESATAYAQTLHEQQAKMLGLKGEARWANDGAQKLKLSDADAQSLTATPKGKRLLIQASDLKPGSPAMQRVYEQIQKELKGAK